MNEKNFVRTFTKVFKEEQIQRAKYFAEIKWKSEQENTQYSVDRFYQNEVIEAFQKVFCEEFGS